MIKTLFIASATAVVFAGAFSMAVANNSSSGKTAIVGGQVASESQTGVVDCTNQIWPAIESYCLEPVSDLGKMRQARQIVM